MTDVTAPTPQGQATADAAFAAAKAEALGQPTVAPAAAPGNTPAATTADAPIVAVTGADDAGSKAPAAPPVQIGGPGPADTGGLEAKEDGAVVTYDPTGDAGMDLALGFIGKLGIKPGDPEMVEAAKGNFAFLKAKLATLGDPARGWEQYVALGEQSFTNAVKADEARVASINTAIGAVMDQPTLTAVLTFAAANASPEEKAYFNSQLAASPLAASVAAKELLRLYQASSGATVNPKRVTNTPTGNYQDGPAKALTRSEYAKEVDAIARRVGGSNLESSPEYQALNRRFAAQQS